MDDSAIPPCVGNHSVSEGPQGLGSQTEAAPLRKKPFSETWLAGFLEKLVLLVITFGLTGVLGVLVAEHVKRSFAIQDLKITEYKARLEDQRRFAEDLIRKINDATAKTHTWVLKLTKYSDTSEANEVFIEHLLESMSLLLVLRTLSEKYVAAFCDDDLSPDDCLKPFEGASEQLQKVTDSLVEAEVQDTFHKPADFVAKQNDLVRKSSALESFMFRIIRQ